MVEFGKPPRAVLRIDVTEVYFHCGKALMRSKLWATIQGRARGDAEHRRDDPRPSGLGERESQEVVYERYKTQL